jgi:hypothetical protein
MAKVKVTYWKEIPVSVMVKETRDNKANVQLSKIYMVTVDAVATKSGATSASDYAAGFRYEDSEQPCTDAKVLAEQIAAELELKYPKSGCGSSALKLGLVRKARNSVKMRRKNNLIDQDGDRSHNGIRYVHRWHRFWV